MEEFLQNYPHILRERELWKEFLETNEPSLTAWRGWIEMHYKPDVATYDTWTRDPAKFIMGRLTGELPAETWHGWYRINHTKAHGQVMLAALNRCDATMDELTVKFIWLEEHTTYWLDNALRKAHTAIARTAQDIEDALPAGYIDTGDDYNGARGRGRKAWRTKVLR